MGHYNQLTDSESERLYVLLEELGEVQQAIGKILRHGYESKHPTTGESNREALQRELGDATFMLGFMSAVGDINTGCINHYAQIKSRKINPYLHHNNVIQDQGE